MTIHWLYLLAGLFFTLLPGKYLRGNECRHFEYDQMMRRMTDKSRRRRRWWKLPAVWIEPIRGYMAVFALREGLQRTSGASWMLGLLPTIIIILLLTIGTSIQMRGNTDKKQLIAPVGYLGGLILAWFPLAAGLPSVVLGASSAVAFRRWEAGFLLGSMTAFVLGYFFMGRSVSMVWGASIIAWPVILAWLKARTMVLPVRL